jgi:xanthosine utilization system XapX-like protein
MCAVLVAVVGLIGYYVGAVLSGSPISLVNENAVVCASLKGDTPEMKGTE